MRDSSISKHMKDHAAKEKSRKSKSKWKFRIWTKQFNRRAFQEDELTSEINARIKLDRT